MYMRAKQRAAVEFIHSHPGTFLTLLARRILDTWTAWYDAHIDVWVVALHLGWIWVAFCGLLSLSAGLGLVLAARRNFLEVLPLALCAIVLPVPYYVTHSSLRYRHPIDPLLTILAVYFVGETVARIKKNRPDVRDAK